MSLNHTHEGSWAGRLIATMVMNLIIPVIQIYGGILSGSMALISDALHNLSDFVSVALSYAALLVGRRGPSPAQTFGYKRVEVFAAFVNVAFLYAVAFYIAIESRARFQNPHPIREQIVIWIALAGFAGNMICTLMLKAGAKNNMNMRSAFLHMLSDALTSLGVVCMGIIWIFKPWYWIDPVVSWVIVSMIVYSGWGILKEAFYIMMNATPPEIDVRDIQKAIEEVDGVLEIHHLHLWKLSSEGTALAAHIVVSDRLLSDVDCLAAGIRDILLRRFRIDHPVLQFETKAYEETGLLHCPAQNYATGNGNGGNHGP